jgi:hypothetical protein
MNVSSNHNSLPGAGAYKNFYGYDRAGPEHQGVEISGKQRGNRSKKGVK